jgi:zinc transporter 6
MQTWDYFPQLPMDGFLEYQHPDQRNSTVQYDVSILCFYSNPFLFKILNFLFSVITCILSVWIERNGPNPVFSFGYERFEVLAMFASTVLAQLGSLFIAKASIERLLLEQPEIRT